MGIVARRSKSRNLDQQILASGTISFFLLLIRQDVGHHFTQGGVLAAASILVYALMYIPVGFWYSIRPSPGFPVPCCSLQGYC